MNDISFERVPIDTSANVSTTPEPRHNFSKILLKNNKGKHKTAKKIGKHYQKMGQNRDRIRRPAQLATAKKLKILRYRQYSGNTEMENYNDDVDIDDINDIKEEDIFIDHNFFSNTDTQNISNLVEIKSDIDKNDILFEDVPIDTKG